MAVKWLLDPQIDINSEKLVRIFKGVNKCTQVPIKRAVEIRCPNGLSGGSGLLWFEEGC